MMLHPLGLTPVQIIANPAATLTRTLTNTFAGIAPGSALPFIAAELLGAASAVPVIAILDPRVQETAPDVVLPHEQEPRPRHRAKEEEADPWLC